ncbi:MAG: hypothetical protein J5736_00165, partial [Bacilli bacterium]|nr:hypothetical protein [Bacilli bacterium]
ILADEPTGNLDTKNSKTILSLLKSLAKDRLVLIVSHNLNLVRLYADLAFSIKDGQFVSLDPSSIPLDSAYGESAIELAKMEQEEIDSPSLMVKLYVAKGEKKQKISIIQKNGKLVLIAENAQAMKPDEVSIVDGDEANAQTKGETVNEELLQFKESKEDPKASRKSRWARIKRAALSVDGTGKRKVIGHLYRSFEILAPLAIFLAVDAMAIAFREVDRKLGYEESYADSISFIGEAREADATNEIFQTRSFDFEDAFHWLHDDNGISAFYPGYGNHDYGALNFEVNSLLPVSYGASGTPTIVAQNYDFVSIEGYRNVNSFSALRKYNLTDDEVVLPLQLLGDFVECPCFGGKPLLETIIGTKIKMGRPVLVETEENHVSFELTIVGVEDLPIDHVPTVNTALNDVKKSYTMPFFVSEKKAIEMRTYAAASYANRTYAQNMLLPKFDDYVFYDFGTTARENLLEGASPRWTLARGYSYVEHVLDEYSEDVLAAAVARGLPIFFLSEAAYNDLPANMMKQLRFFGEKVGRYSILKESDPNEKAVYFITPSYFQETAVYSSRDRFFGALVANAVTFNHITEKPEGSTADALFDRKDHHIDIVIPSAYENHLGKFEIYPVLEEGLDIWQSHAETGALPYNPLQVGSIVERDLIPMTIRVVGTYPSNSIYDPVYLDPLAEFYLQGNVSDFAINTGAEEGVNPELVAYTDPLLLFSNDVAKTKRYFSENLERFGVSAHTKRDLYYSTVRSDYVYIYFDYLFPIGALLIVIFVLVMLNAAAKVNANKAGYGVLRCLGKKRGEILAEDSFANLLHSLLFTCIPLAFLALVLILFDLYLLGWWVVPFFFAYSLLILVFSELPLLLTLRKPPIEIMHSLQ